MCEESVAVELDRIFRDIREIDYCLDVWLDGDKETLESSYRRRYIRTKEIKGATL